MQNKLLIIPLVLILIVVFALAKPDTTLVPAANNKANIQLMIPAHAVEVAPNVFSLGSSTDIDGRAVEGFMFIDKKREAKPGTSCGNGICEAGENANKCPVDCSGGTTESTCFAFMASGAKWKTTEQYVLDTANNDSLSSSFVADNVELGINAWDSQVAFDLFGSRNISNVVDGADTANPDGKNEIFFGSLSDSNTIAVTIVWGIFRGPPFSRELVEYDMVFNDANYTFRDAELAPAPQLMDFLNIFTHEQGHSAGMDHPDITCTEETMYSFASFNETKKRTLNDGDITGIRQLYS